MTVGERTKQIVELRQQGLSYADIARRIGISDTNVIKAYNKWQIQGDIVFKSTRLVNGDGADARRLRNNNIIKLWSEGLPYVEIAKRVKVSKTVVGNVVAEHKGALKGQESREEQAEKAGFDTMRGISGLRDRIRIGDRVKVTCEETHGLEKGAIVEKVIEVDYIGRDYVSGTRTIRAGRSGGTKAAAEGVKIRETVSLYDLWKSGEIVTE